MAKKTKKESVEIQDTNMAAVECNGITFNVKDHLSYQEMLMFSSTVLSACFNKETGEYRPHIFDFITKVCAISLYSDVALPESIEEKYEFVYGTNVVSEIISRVNESQYYEIIRSIRLMIEYEASVSSDHLRKGVEDMYNSMNALLSQVSGMFDGVSKEDISALTKALGSGVLDENKIAEAYVQAKKTRPRKKN